MTPILIFGPFLPRCYDTPWSSGRWWFNSPSISVQAALKEHSFGVEFERETEVKDTKSNHCIVITGLHANTSEKLLYWQWESSWLPIFFFRFTCVLKTCTYVLLLLYKFNPQLLVSPQSWWISVKWCECQMVSFGKVQTQPPLCQSRGLLELFEHLTHSSDQVTHVQNSGWDHRLSRQNSHQSSALLKQRC